MPLFLTELTALLQETMTEGEEDAARAAMNANATARGQHLLSEGLTIGQVVHGAAAPDYLHEEYVALMRVAHIRGDARDCGGGRAPLGGRGLGSTP